MIRPINPSISYRGTQYQKRNISIKQNNLVSHPENNAPALKKYAQWIVGGIGALAFISSLFLIPNHKKDESKFNKTTETSYIKPEQNKINDMQIFGK